MKFSFPPLALSLGLMLPLVSAGLAGCGGGGGSGPSTPRATPTPTRLPVTGSCTATTYEPNYVSSLETLQQWPVFPLRIFLNSTDARTRALTIRGFDQWVTATNNRVRYTLVTDAEQADITVKFGLLRPGSETLGITTTYFFEGQSRIERAEIEFFYYPFDSRADAEDVNQSVAAHEFGHVLGISGHSPERADLMFARATGGLKEVTTRDLNTLRTSYCDNFPTRRSNSTPPPKGVLQKRVIS